MKITKLRTNHMKNPLGFELSRLSLSWITESAESHSIFQEAAQVQIALDPTFSQIVFDSEKQQEIDSLAYTPDIKLEPTTRYYWRVTVFGNEGDQVTSDVAWFETAKMDQPWNGRWITPDLDKEIHPLVRKKFTLPDDITSARIYISGVGLYHLEINGTRVGDEYFTPGYNAYDFWLQYQTYDITNLLAGGENAIGVMLGNGWYKGRFGIEAGTELYGDKFAVIAEIIATRKDGSKITIASDDTWKSAPSPITFSGIYDGEIYDATREIDNWSSAQFDDNDWITVSETTINSERLQARLGVPIIIAEELKPVEIIHTPKGETVLDLGQVMTGWLRFKTEAPKGTKLHLEFGEILQDDCFYRENLRSAKAEYTYISDGSTREVEPYFTFYGFRYVKLTGFDESLNINDFTGCVIYSDIEEIGSIETSNPLVNQLFKNAMWGQKGNFLDVPTDCPQRDERLGWTGDAQIFASTACYNMYSPAFFAKYMFDLREEQLRMNGSVPFFVPMFKPDPNNKNAFLAGNGSAAWGDAATVIPWDLYRHYGDKELLRSQFNTMKDWVDFIKRQDDESGSTRLWKKGFHFGDWLALDGDNPDSPFGGTENFFIASAYYCYSARLVAKAASVLGYADLEKEYSELVTEIKDAIAKEYFTPNGRSAINTQTAMIVSLYMDLIPKSYKERMIKDLREKLVKDNMHLKTGFVGTPYFCNVLSEYGASEDAYTLLLNEDYPSWLYAVKLGATTIWERWNSVLPDGKISSTGMNSLNHYAYGSIAEWMYRHMCGINPVEAAPGFRKILFKPQPDGRIQEAKATLQSASGTIKSGWKIGASGILHYSITVPFNTKAEVVLPNVSIDRILLNGQNIRKTEYTIEQTNDCVIISNVLPGEYVFEYLPIVSYINPFSSKSLIRELFQHDHAKKAVFSVFPELEKNQQFSRFVGNKRFDDLKHEPFTSHFVTQEKLDLLNKELESVSLWQSV